MVEEEEAREEGTGILSTDAVKWSPGKQKPFMFDQASALTKKTDYRSSCTSLLAAVGKRDLSVLPRRALRSLHLFPAVHFLGLHYCPMRALSLAARGGGGGGGGGGGMSIQG